MIKATWLKASSLKWGGLLVLAFITHCIYQYSSLKNVPYYYFDEPYYVNASESLANSEAIENWEHPPLGKLAILMGRVLFQDGVYGSRFFGVVASQISLLFLCFSAYLIFSRTIYALIPAFLAMTDPLFVTLSNIAMLDIYMIFFEVLILFTFICYLKTKNTKLLYMIAVLSGLGFAVKWSIFPILLAIALWLVFMRPYFVKQYLICTVIFLTTYFSTFYPYFFVDAKDSPFILVLSLQKEMLNYHTNFVGSDTHASSFWTWPLLIKPIWLKLDFSHATVKGIFNVGNAVTYFSFYILLAAKLLTRRVFSQSDKFFLLCCFLCFFLWWLVSDRTQFFHHYLTLSPVIYLLLARMIKELPRRLQIGLLFGVFIFYLIYLPTTFYWPLSLEHFYKIIPFSSWRYLF